MCQAMYVAICRRRHVEDQRRRAASAQAVPALEEAENIAIDQIPFMTPEAIWSARRAFWPVYSWLSEQAPSVVWKAYQVAPAPGSDVLFRQNKHVPGVPDLRWNAPRPLFWAMRWYLQSLQWSERPRSLPGEAPPGTSLCMLAADFEMSTGLRLGTSKREICTSLQDTASVFLTLARRVGAISSCS